MKVETSPSELDEARRYSLRDGAGGGSVREQSLTKALDICATNTIPSTACFHH